MVGKFNRVRGGGVPPKRSTFASQSSIKERDKMSTIMAIGVASSFPGEHREPEDWLSLGLIQRENIRAVGSLYGNMTPGGRGSNPEHLGGKKMGTSMRGAQGSPSLI